ncbi:HTH_48 domain-containing protein [Trichonephila clavipes]|nr:HTH_48 domain-containing protein [Trichonephila clavipes]
MKPLNTLFKHLRHCFRSSVSKRGIHLAHSFLMSKCSDNMRCTTLFEKSTMFASSRTFSRRSSSTTLWIFFPFLEWLPHFDDHCDAHLDSSYGLSFKLCSTQYFTVVNEGKDSPRVESR